MIHSIEHLLPCPYAHLNRDLHLSRLSADISYEDKEFLHLIFPARGLFNRLTQVFFHSLVSECKQNGITTYSPENADYLARLIARRCSFAEPVGQGLDQNVTGGTPGACDNPPGSQLQSDDAQAPPHQQEGGNKVCSGDGTES